MKYAKVIIKWIIAIVLLSFALASIDIDHLFGLLYRINFYWLFVAFITFIFIRILMAIRWQFLLKIYDIKPLFKTTLKIVLLSTVLGIGLPAGIGADIIRIYQMTDNEGNVSKVTSSIVIDRFIGLYSMLFVAFISSFCLIFISSDATLFYMMSVFQILFFLSWIIIFIFRIKIMKYQERSELINDKSIKSKAFQFLLLITDMDRIKKIFIKMFSLSLVVQIFRVIWFYFLFLSLGVHVDLILLHIFIPILFVLIMLPISIGGLGVREAYLVYFGSHYGIDNAVCFSAGILSQVLIIASLSISLLIFLNEYYVAKKAK